MVEDIPGEVRIEQIRKKLEDIDSKLPDVIAKANLAKSGSLAERALVSLRKERIDLVREFQNLSNTDIRKNL